MTVRICVHVKAKSLKTHQGLWNLCEPLSEWVEEHLWWCGGGRLDLPEGCRVFTELGLTYSVTIWQNQIRQDINTIC